MRFIKYPAQVFMRNEAMAAILTEKIYTATMRLIHVYTKEGKRSDREGVR